MSRWGRYDIGLNRFFVSEYSRTSAKRERAERARAVSIASSSANTPGQHSSLDSLASGAGVSIASSSANTPGRKKKNVQSHNRRWSQSLLRQRILPDLITGPRRMKQWKLSQSLLRQRILPDSGTRAVVADASGKSQSLLRQRILPDHIVSRAGGDNHGSLNRFFVSEYSRT